MSQAEKGFFDTPMTRILLILNERSVLMTESPLSARQIVAAVQSGKLQGLPAEMIAFTREGKPSVFEAGGLVVISGRRGWDLPDLSPEIRQRSYPPGEPCLTPREAEVLQALAQGLTIKEIAFRLRIRPRTIRQHVRNLNEKFGAQTTEQAVGRGVLLGLCRSPEPLDGEIHLE